MPHFIARQATMSLVFAGVSAIFLAASPKSAQAQVLNPLNGHFYQLITGINVNWEQARLNANSRTLNGQTGYLATITSASEQAFLQTAFDFGNVPSFGTYIGGFQSLNSFEPAGGWQWVTGESGPVSPNYTNWGGSEPNNSFGTEDRIEITNAPRTETANYGRWNDITGTDTRQSFLVEFNAAAVAPEPGSAALGLVAVAGAVALRRRRRGA